MSSSFEKLKEKKYKIKDNISGYDKNFLIKTFRLPNGIIENFFIDNDKNSVQIFPLTTDNKIITVKQFRPNTEKENIELPGGGLEKGEDPLEGALRELKEETTFTGDLQFLCKVPYSPYSVGCRYMFVANNCERVDSSLDLDDNEFLKVILWTPEKFKELLTAGKIRGIDTVYLGLQKLNMLDLFQ